MDPFDVLIVGAGPAGCAAAIRCAAQGARVGLIETLAFSRERPGETLHPGVEQLFDQLGVGAAVRAANFVRHPGIRVRQGSGPWQEQAYGVDERGPWLGFQAPGGALDTLLLTRAVEVGVTLIRPARALAPCLRDGNVTGVETTTGTFHARWVLDGTGSRQWLARSLGIGNEHHSPKRTVSFGYAGGEFTDDSWPELHCTDAG